MKQPDYKKLALQAKCLYALLRNNQCLIPEQHRGRFNHLLYRVFLRYERRLLLLNRAGGSL